MDTVFTAPRVLLNREFVGPATVRVRDGRIAEITVGDERAERGATAEVLPDGVLTPGLVDVQINGAVGVDFAETTEQAMRTVARGLPRTGVTRFLPTLITAPVPRLVKQGRAVIEAMAALPDDAGARPFGLHLEGPFLSPQRPGVHDPALMSDPTPEQVGTLLTELGSSVRAVTLAPERPGGLEAVRQFAEFGALVCVGHTDALGVEVRAAADAGATMITHLFNAQRPLGHREPGVPGIGLVDERYALGLIGDLAHVGPDVCQLVFAAAGDRVALVTDAVAAAGMPPGRYQLGGVDVLLDEEGVPRSPGGTIAGSALTLDRAVRNMVSLGVDPAVVLTAATETPANTIGERALGRLAPGAVADLVWWDDDFHPRKVWVNGRVVFDATVPEPAVHRLPTAGH